jgi:hypothetical protein
VELNCYFLKSFQGTLKGWLFCYYHPSATFTFGAVQRGISHSQDLSTRHAVLWEDGDA